MKNLRALSEQGARGRYGYFESIDYTPGRIPAGKLRAVVKAYFAHHQGMSLVALGNELTDGSMRGRFHLDPMVCSAELLLQERVPRNVQLAHPHVEEVRNVRSIRELPPPDHALLPARGHPGSGYALPVQRQLLGDGHQRWWWLQPLAWAHRSPATAKTSRAIAGGSSSTCATSTPIECGALHTTRCPASRRSTTSLSRPTKPSSGGAMATSRPARKSPSRPRTMSRYAASPSSNRGLEPRRIEVTSYFEIALTEQGNDQAHKSFSNLFVETELLEETGRCCSPAAHARPANLVPTASTRWAAVRPRSANCRYETDRARFLGRLRQVDAPLGMETEGPLSGHDGRRARSVMLDSSRSDSSSPAQARDSSTRQASARSRDGAMRLAEKYHDVRNAQRAIDLGWTAAQIELRDMGLSAQESVVLQRLASRLLLTDPTSVLKVKTPVENGLQISGLWSLGISGDHPILLVRVDEIEHAPLVRQALLAHQYWRHKGLIADLVILNTRPTGYSDQLDDRLRLLVRTGHALQLMDKPGGVFLRRSDQMHPDVLNLLLTVARATLDGDGGPIELQLDRRGARPEDPEPFVPTREPERFDHRAFKRPELEFDNGYRRIRRERRLRHRSRGRRHYSGSMDQRDGDARVRMHRL